MRPQAAPTTPLITLRLLWMAALLSTLTILLLTGCGTGRLLPASPQPGVALHGHVHGGQQPVSGANVYLLAANTTGYAGAGITPSGSNSSLSLLNSADTGNSDGIGAYVTTAVDGSFDISGDYTCTPGQQVYLYASGGNSGGGANSAAGFLTLLGNCPAAGNLEAIPYVEMNEISTTAAAFSFAAFASDPIHVSTNGTTQALTGIANAFANASNLVDLGSGTALATTPAGNGTVPQATLNTLGNILASCVNTSDSPTLSASPHPLAAHPHTLPYSNGCILLGEAVSGGDLNQFYGYTYDTATAAIFIAHNPGANISSLFTLPTPQAPFNPFLTSQPSDFTLSIVFTGGGITTPTAVANDSLGGLWIVDANNTLDALTPLGVPLTGSPFKDSSISNPGDIAVDPSNNVWLTNAGYQAYSVSNFSSTGAFSFSTGLPYLPAGLSIDAGGNAWVPNANNNNSGLLTEVSPSGTSTNVLTGLNYPQFSVFDNSGFIWFDSSNTIGVTGLNTATSTTVGPYTAGGMSSTGSLAVDSRGNIWGLNYDTSLVGIDDLGNALSGIPYNTGTSRSQNAFAIDGQNSFWIASYHFVFSGEDFISTSYLTAVSASGTTLLDTIIPTPLLSAPFPQLVNIHSLAIDSSGDIWLPAGNQVVEYIGIATPIETPMAQAVADYCIAQRPCVLTPP